MPFILREETSTENPSLATVYGKQITAGKLVYYYKDSSGRQKGILFLGQGEMDGIDQILYKGEALDNADWVFHPGTITTQISPFDVTAISGDTLTLASNPFAAESNIVKEIITASGGSRTLSIVGVTTAPIPYNANPATIQAALNAVLPTTPDIITVANPSAGVYTYTFSTGDGGSAPWIPTFAVNAGGLSNGTSTLVNTGEVALVAGVDVVNVVPTFPSGVAQHLKLFVVYSSGNNIKLSLTAGGPAIDWTAQMAVPAISSYLLTNLKVYSATRGYFDPIQGRPRFFPDISYTFSGIAYVEFNLNTTMSDMAEVPEDFKIFVRGRRLQNYTSTGLLADASGTAFPDQNNLPAQTKFFSANNALVAVDIMLNYMKISSSRIDWPTFVKFRDHCDTPITWNSGSSTTYATPTWTLQNVTELGVGTLQKNNASANPPNAAAISTQSFTLSDELTEIKYKGVFRTGAQSHGITDASGIPGSISGSSYTVRFSVSSQGQINIYANKSNTPVYTGTTVDGMQYGETFEIVITKGLSSTTWKVYRSDTVLWSGTVTSGGTGALRVMSDFSDASAQATGLKAFPMASVSRTTPRFDAHIVFPSEISSITALEQAMGRAPSCHWQDVNGKIKFIVGSTYKNLLINEVPNTGDRVLAHLIAYDPTQTTVKSNIIEGSFSTYKKPASEKQNFLRTEFRDIEDEFFLKKYSFTDRPALRDYIKSLRDFGIVQIGVATQSLSDRVSESILRWNTDLDLFIKVKCTAETLALAKGDLVKIAHDIPDWTLAEAPVFVIVDETFEEGTADERSFTLQVYNPEYYSDTAHGPISPGLPSGGSSPLTPPPKPLSLDLTEGGVLTGNVYIPSIEGTVHFDLTYTSRQRARVYLKRPGESVFINTGIVLEQPTPTTATLDFEIQNVALGVNTVRVITESTVGVLAVDYITPDPTIDVVGISTAVPGNPTGMTATLSQGVITWSWTAPSPAPDHYEIRDGAEVVKRIEFGTSWSEPLTYGTSSVTRKVYSVSAYGVYSASASSYTLNITIPTAPSLYTISNLGTVLEHRWTSPAAFQGRQFEIASDSGFTSVLWRGVRAEWDEPSPLTSGNITRYLRIMNTITGVPSSSVTYTLNLQAPAAPTGLTYSFPARGILWEWTASVTPNVEGYKIYSDAGLTTLIGTVSGTQWTQKLTVGVDSYTIYVVAYIGAFRSTAATATYSVVPNPPTGMAASAPTQGTTTWSWTAPVSSPELVHHYDITDGVGTLLRVEPGLSWVEVIPPGTTGTLTRRVYSVTSHGTRSATYSSNTLNLNSYVPATPTGYSITYDGNTLAHTWTHTFFDGREFEIASDSGFTSILWRGTTTNWNEASPGATGTITRYLRARSSVTGLTSSNVSTTVNVDAPAEPASVTATYDGASIVWSWTPSVSTNVTTYKIYADNLRTTLLATVTGTQWVQNTTLNQQTYTIYVAAYRSGILSTLNRTGTITIADPATPTGYAVGVDGSTFVHTWDYVGNYVYTIYDASNVQLWQGFGNQWIEAIGPTVTGSSHTRKIKATNSIGRSSSVYTLNFSIAALPAPTTVSFLTAQATPFEVPISITAPAALVQRNVRKTVVEVLNSSGGALLYTLYFDGVAESAMISGRYTNVPSVTVRVKYVDYFNNASSWTNSTVGSPHSFSPVSGGDISLTIASFAADMRPVRIISAGALPSVPDSTYLPGDVVYWIGAPTAADKKLWRTPDGSPTYNWTKAVDGVDIVANSITAGQIAAGAINTQQLAAGAVTAEKLAVGPSQENLVRNPSFEDTYTVLLGDGLDSGGWSPGDVVPLWWKSIGTNITGLFYASTTQKADGGYSLAIPASNGGPGCQAFAVTPNTSYVLRFKIYAADSAGTYTVRCMEYNSALPAGVKYISYTSSDPEVTTYNSIVYPTNVSDNVTLSSVARSTVSGQWVEKTCLYVTGPNAKYMSISFDTAGGAGYTYVDDIAFRRKFSGVLIENNTITAQNLVIGGMTDNLISNPSFEHLEPTDNGVGGRIQFPQTWTYANAATLSACGATSYAVGGSKAVAIPAGIGKTIVSRVIPVTPRTKLSIKYRMWFSAAGQQATVAGYFLNAMPTSGTERNMTYIGSGGADGLTTYSTSAAFAAPGDNLSYTTLQATATTDNYYERQITVPDNVYFMSLAIRNESASQTLYIDDITVKAQTGSAFISYLTAAQITANQAQIGLVFADQIKQANYTSYQPGSTFNPSPTYYTNGVPSSFGWNSSLGSGVQYDSDTRIMTYTGNSYWDSTNTVYTHPWQKITAGTNGYFEFTCTEKAAGKYVRGGLFAAGYTNFASYGAGSYYYGLDYHWELNADGTCNIFESNSLNYDCGTYQIGDVFRVGVENGYVKYRKNGKLMYTSTYKPTEGTVRYNGSTDLRGGIQFGCFGIGTSSVSVKGVSLVQEATGQGWSLNPISGGSYYNQEPIWSGYYGTFYDQFGVYMGVVPPRTDILHKANSNGWTSPNGCYVMTEQVIAKTSSVTGFYTDGWVQATIDDATTSACIGLVPSANSNSETYTDMSYSIVLDRTQLGTSLISIVENGSIIGGAPLADMTYTAGDTFRVGIEGSVVKYRKNGALIYTSVNALPTTTYSYRGKLGIYHNNRKWTSIRITSASSGTGEFNSGITVRGTRVEDIVNTVTKAVRADNRYRGNDTDTPSVIVTSITQDGYFCSFEDNACFTTLTVEVADYRTNPTKNMDSVRSVRTRVFNKFGELVKTQTMPWSGRGTVFSGYIPRDGCDAYEEAVFSIEFENIYGYSNPIWYSDAYWVKEGRDAAAWVESNIASNISFSPPVWVARRTCPTNTKAVALTPTSARITWTKAESQSAGANNKIYYRKFNPFGFAPTDTTNPNGWILYATVPDVSYDITDLQPGERYEFMPTNFLTKWTGPIAQIRMPSLDTAVPTYLAPASLAAQQHPTDYKKINLTWTPNKAANWFRTDIYYSLTDDPNPGTFLVSFSANEQSYTHDGTFTLSDNQTVYYKAKNIYNGGGNSSEWSNGASATTKASPLPTTTPTSLTGTATGYFSIRANWTENGGGTSVRVEVQYANVSSWTSPVAVSDYAVTSGVRTITGLLSGTDYKIRVKDSAGSVWSNIAYVSTWIYDDGGGWGGCILPWQTVLGVDAYNNIVERVASTVQVGDRLFGRNAVTGDIEISAVRDVLHKASRTICKIKTKDGYYLQCSDSHRIITAEYDNRGTDAIDLKVGDYVMVYDRIRDKFYCDTIDSIAYEEGSFDVITFTMDSRDHTYISEGILSHNSKELV